MFSGINAKVHNWRGPVGKSSSIIPSKLFQRITLRTTPAPCKKMSTELADDEIAPFIVIVVVTFLGIYFFYWLFSNSLFIVRHAEVMIVERWGKYHTTLKPGLHWLWPVMDSPRQVKWRYVSPSPSPPWCTCPPKKKCGCTTHRFLQDFFSAILTGKK